MKVRFFSMAVLAGVMVLGMSATAAAKPPIVKSNFNSGNDNWGVVDNFIGHSTLDPAAWTPTGGDPGAYIYAGDDDSGPGENITAFISYQDKFSGNFSPYYGGKIKLDLMDNETSSKPVRIVLGTGSSPHVEGFFATARPSPGPGWQNYSVPLNAKRWKFVTFNGSNGGARQPATKRIMKTALKTLGGVFVVADYSQAPGEVVSLDNYAWVPPSR